MNLYELVKEAALQTTIFDSVVDGIDFNSYLHSCQESRVIKKSSAYKRYVKSLKDTRAIAEEFYNAAITTNPKDLGEFDTVGRRLLCGQCRVESMSSKYVSRNLIALLFVVKTIRVRARLEYVQPRARQDYEDAISLIHIVLASIPRTKSKISRSIEALCYLELSICYSGIPEASLALGCAIRAKDIMVSPPKLDIFKLLKAYAEYCEAEAQRIAHETSNAMAGFNEVFKDVKAEQSTRINAQRLTAEILNDIGRSSEAIEKLEEARKTLKRELPHDYRINDCGLKIASAIIDKKNYDTAEKELRILISRRGQSNTFIVRKAKLHLADCRIMDKNELDESSLKNIMVECIDRLDQENFRYAWRLYAKHYRFLNKRLESESKGKRDSADASRQDDKEKEMAEEEIKGLLFICLCSRVFDFSQPTVERQATFESFYKKPVITLRKIVIKNDRCTQQAIKDFENKEELNSFLKTYRHYMEKNIKEEDDDIVGGLKKKLIELYNQSGELEEVDRIAKKRVTDYRKEWIVASKKFLKENYRDVKKVNVSNYKDYRYLECHSIEKKMFINTELFINKVVLPSRQVLPVSKDRLSAILTVLRRWNSFTPSLASAIDPSKGGGFFLYVKEKKSPPTQKGITGIIIDPGYDYLDNFFSEGFSLADVNCVVVSHNHPDHTDSLPQLLSLFHEMNRRLGSWKPCYRKTHKPHKVKFIISRGVFETYKKHFDINKEAIEDIVVLDSNQDSNKPIQLSNVMVQPFKTSHKDLTKSGSFGFVFEVSISRGTSCRIGYTGDAQWTRDLGNRLGSCKIICANLGSIIDIFDNQRFLSAYKGQENLLGGYGTTLESGIKKQLEDKNHLYLSGMAMLLNQIGQDATSKLELCVMSEFGEELKSGIRLDLFHKFDDWFRETDISRRKIGFRCLPGDIGLRIDALTGDIYCHHCEQFTNMNEISPLAYGFQEALFFVCAECTSVFSRQQISTKLDNLYLRGRILDVGHSQPECIGIEKCSYGDLCSSAE